MKIIRVLPLLCLALVTTVSAQTAFPGLKEVLTAAEWQRAGLDRLTPDQLGVLDAALIRYQATLLAARPASPAPVSVAEPRPEPKRGWMERFGLPVVDGEWRDVPPLKAKVVAWETANRFRLDNGQVWEGFEPITYELVGKAIEIQARPAGRYALIVEGQNTTIRVMRLR